MGGHQVAMFPRERVKVLSLGGGLDSFAMLVDAIGRGELPDLVIFADVADPAHEDPGEWPGTYRHLSEVVVPLCRRHGIEWKWLGTDESPIRGRRSLWAYLAERRIIPSKQRRLCSAAAKVERISDYLLERFGRHGVGVEVWIGFDAAEEHRAQRDPHAVRDGASGWRVNRFPLMARELCRCRSEALVRAAGFPVPRKSACIYCPHATRRDFHTLSVELPERFAQVAKLESDCRLTKAGKVMTYGYVRGDGTDPVLREWVSRPFGSPRTKACPVCGAAVRATKATACGWLDEGVQEAA